MRREHWILLSLVLIVLGLIYCMFCLNIDNDKTKSEKRENFKLLSKNFYSVEEVCPELNLIHSTLPLIRAEVEKVRDDEWPDWPEKELYDKRELKSTIFDSNPDKRDTPFKWNIYPFTAFGVVVKENCRRCPELWKFLQKIPGLKIALLSKLGPGVKLNTHQGWGNHSNHVIRCHFGFDVPYGCYVSVRDKLEDDEEIRLHKENDWIVFDDSRHHYAHNPTNRERIVLIVDVERPDNIKPGTSVVGDTKELLQIVDYFRNTDRLS
ncbi:cupin superfamily aspartyl/asparaginyl beta-hydroxylase [Yasminevirus sp. GU-2018]|uniref:Cupin superfamily aspartyl/asparaginyl beta-hydroxylase n=1 Tax=Yasminevirus sp. GU-2018 TaxID=2420051 RepID=A0A5K0U725_9VIRU|nr:cupin superfamily aspartyl/asparaginyl beta-hydroxylase [Yasminevirus sp. GU-2018]